ncbi:MAG: CRISPR-associated protein Cas4 [Tepidanaerobacteraceae bacterium]|nr:CRISPR-associated protein Cas4 [Tepidanaerobacteraceae bacterium]
MKYTEDNLLPLSYLSQYYYCPRRAALLLIERLWSDNIHTMSGTIIHQRVDKARQEKRSDLIRLTSLPVRSLELGLFGVADSVEFFADQDGYKIENLKGRWEVVPVEYKHGRVRDELEYEVQLSGQAICLEEMLGITIHRGYIYYAGDRRRKEVQVASKLRQLVEQGARALREMLATGNIPPVTVSSKCRECSLGDDCFPLSSPQGRAAKKRKVKTSAARYIKSIWDDIESGEEL